MTDAPATRKTHVIRILGTNKAGDILSDLFVDVERIDVAKTVTQTQETLYQGRQRKLLWNDDPDGGDGTGNPSRTTVDVKIFGQDQDINDPEEFIIVKAIKYMKIKRTSQGVQRKFLDDPSLDVRTSRIVEVRRISNCVTSIDDEAQAAFDNDATRKVYVVPGSRYTLDLTTKDLTQYVEHEIVKYLKGRGDNGQANLGQSFDQGKQTKVLNQYIIDQSDPSPGTDDLGLNGFNPPFRLDPFQTIVNVQLAPLDNTFVVVTTHGYIYTSDNGFDWVLSDGHSFFRGSAGYGQIFSGLYTFGRWSDTDGNNNPAFLIGGSSFVNVVNGEDISPDSSAAVLIASRDGYDWFDISLPFVDFGTQSSPDVQRSEVIGFGAKFSGTTWGSHSKLVTFLESGNLADGTPLNQSYTISSGDLGLNKVSDDFEDNDSLNVTPDSYADQKDGFKKNQSQKPEDAMTFGFGNLRMKYETNPDLQVRQFLISFDRGKSYSPYVVPTPGGIALGSASNTLLFANGDNLDHNAIVYASKDGKTWTPTLHVARASGPTTTNAVQAIITGRVKKPKRV